MARAARPARVAIVAGEASGDLHGADFVRGAVADAGLTMIEMTAVSSRTENRIPVPGLLAVAQR